MAVFYNKEEPDMKERKPIVCCFCPLRPCLLLLFLILIPLIVVTLYASFYDPQYIYIIIASGCPATICNENNGWNVIGNKTNVDTAKQNDLGVAHDVSVSPDSGKEKHEKHEYVVLESYHSPKHQNAEASGTPGQEANEDQTRSFIDRVVLSFVDITRSCNFFPKIPLKKEDLAETMTETKITKKQVEESTEENTVLVKNLVDPASRKPLGDKVITTHVVLPEEKKKSSQFDESKPIHIDYEELGFNIPNSGACPAQGKDLKLIVGIHSPPRNKAQRDAIRETWATLAQFEGYSYVFIVGFELSNEVMNRLKHESNENGDIMQTSLLDREDTLTMQSVLFLKWIQEECSQVKFAMKTNDDVFVNLPLIAYELERKDRKEKAIYGFLYKPTTTVAETGASTALTVQPKQQTLPEYMTTEGYIFPAYLAPVLYEAAKEIPTSQRENVFVTGILAEMCDIKRIDVPLFSGKNPADLPSKDPCEVLGYLEVIYPFSPEAMRAFWNGLKDRPKPFECGNFNFYTLKMYPNRNLLYSGSMNNARIHMQPPDEKDTTNKETDVVEKK